MENKTKRKKQKTNQTQKIVKRDFIRNKSFMVLFFILVVIVLFCLYRIALFVQNPTDTFSVEQGRIYQEERGIGYLIREETVVKGSNYKNGMERIKAEGLRVAKGDTIFRYYTNGEEGLIKKIEDLDKKIEEAMAKDSQILRYPSDIKALDKQIEDQILALRQVNNLQTIRETKKSINSNITKKAKIAGDYSPTGSYLKKLIEERSKYENQLNKGAERIKAPISGVVSYKVDGYEEVLTAEDFSKITIEFLEKLNLKTGQVVADSKEEAKIINNFECHIACVLESKQAKEAEVGDSVTLRLPNEVEVLSEIVYKTEEENKVLLIFKIHEQVRALLSYRKMTFNIIWWSNSGKKIPNTAIGKEQKGEKEVAYVTRTRGGYQDKIWIKIRRQNEKYAIVDNYTREELEELGFTDQEISNRKTLTLYDEILKNPT